MSGAIPGLPRLVGAGAIGIACYLLAALFVALPPFADAPTFYSGVEPEGRWYGCDNDQGSAFFVRFEDRGRRAFVRAGRRTISMTFAGDEGMFDVYRGSGWEMTLDPEANLHGPNGIRFTNCY